MSGVRQHGGAVLLGVRLIDALLAAVATTSAILTGGLLAACVLLLLRDVPLQQNADDLLPTIMSLQKLTFYYWEQNRFANLLPLLTAWISDPSANAYMQIGLRIGAGVVSPLFFAVLVFRRAADAWRAALAASALMLLLNSPFLLHETFIVASPYGTSLASGALAMLAARRAWTLRPGCQRALLLGLGVAGLLVAYVVNIALAIVALPLLALRPSVERMRFLLLHAGAASIALLLAGVFAPAYRTSAGLLFSWSALETLLSAVGNGVGWLFPALIGLPVVLSLVAHRYGPARRPVTPFAWTLVAFGLTAIAAFLLLAASDHVRRNAYSPRYCVPILAMLLAAGGIALWQTFRLVMPTRAVRETVFLLLTGLVLLSASGRQSASGPADQDLIVKEKAASSRAIGGRSIALAADAIVGDYWDVWPAVFAAAQVRHDAGNPGSEILGIAPRSWHRGEVRRGAFQARLFAQGHLRLACLDLSPEDCAEDAGAVTGVAGLRVSPFAVAEPIVGGHVLRYAEVSPP